MKSYCVTIYAVFVLHSANAAYIYDDIFSSRIVLTEDTEIHGNARINASVVDIASSLYLNNMGQVNGDIKICNHCEVYIANSGIITGEITIDLGATLTQVIGSAKDLSVLNTAGAYNILVYNATNLAWSDVMDVASGVDKITLANSSISMLYTKPRLRGNQPRIELIGSNEIRLSAADIAPGVALMSNVYGNGTITVVADGIDPLHAVKAFIDGGKLYLQTVRETDYYKILGSDEGRFVNRLRTVNPADKLVDAMDAAKDVRQLGGIMRRSMRINARLLNNPIKTFNRHIRLYAALKTPQRAADARPFFITGDKISAYGAKAGVNIAATGSTAFAVDGYAGHIAFNDITDDFEGALYGGAMTAYTAFDAFRAQLNAGFTTAKLSTPQLYSRAGTTHNPTTNSIYINADVGYKFDIQRSISLMPTAGIGADYIKTLKPDADISARGGIVAAYERQTGDLLYEYAIRALLETDSTSYISAGMKITSPYDETEYGFDIGVLHDDIGTSYKISTSIRCEF